MVRRTLLITTFLSLAGILAACSDSGNGQQAKGGAGAPPPGAVGVISMKEGMLPITAVLPGRAEAYQTADIRPRVTGMIKEITFKEGSNISEGDLLYQIEDDTYKAAVAKAEASVAKAEASVPSAEVNLARYERLVNSGATQIEYENAKVTLLQAKAEVASAKAALLQAQIDLDLTKIRAPFNGIIDETAFNIGNVVTANQAQALTTIRQLDPIYIKLNESSANLLKVRASVQAGEVQGNVNNVDIGLTLEDGRQYNHRGTLDMSKTTVSETTGTFSMRVVFPNPDQLLLPGMYVRATVTLGERKGFPIPQLAASRDADGNLNALFVNAEGKVENRVFKNAYASNNSWLVTENVKDGDKLIVSGLQWIGPGMPVTPTEMTIDENGVVVAVAAPQSETPAAPATN